MDAAKREKLVQEMLDIVNSANYSSSQGARVNMTITIGWTNQNRLGGHGKDKGDRLKEIARLLS